MVGRSGLFAVRLPGGAGEQFGDALLHFARGLVGERDAENVAGRNTLFHHVRDADR